MVYGCMVIPIPPVNLYPPPPTNIIKPVYCLVRNITPQGLASSFVLTHRIRVLKVGAILDVAVWSLISGKSAKFKQRVTI